jgi:hypothetical protein
MGNILVNRLKRFKYLRLLIQSQRLNPRQLQVYQHAAMVDIWVHKVELGVLTERNE